MYLNMAVLAAFVFIYSLIGNRLEKTPVNGALIFMSFGLILGPLGLNVLKVDVDAESLSVLAELTLALVLFTDASNANLKELKHSFHIPQRLLLIGLPLTILLGFATGYVLFDGLAVLELALLATMLAPTDAALGKAVVTNTAVPGRFREALNVESGLNDGICVPILLIFLTLATSESVDAGVSILALELIAKAIGIGALAGVGLTFLGVRLMTVLGSKEWLSETWHQLPVPALALACYATAQWLGGSGFIACFVGGLLFDRLGKHHKKELLLAAEGTGDTLALLTWVAFGVLVAGPLMDSFSWQILVYSVLSLTVVRMLPVFLVLGGMGLRTDEKLFLGWFGPRGLASVVFGVIVLGEHLPGGDTISTTLICTIMMSIVAHGLSANPLAAALAARIRARTTA